MTLDQFVNNYNGQHVDVDQAFGGQCWDLVELYAEQVLSVPKQPWAITLGPNGSAREAWTVFDGHMQRYFEKHAGGEKRKGDILVYGYAPDGHIAISLGGSSVFQENSPVGSVAHIGNNSDNGLLGVLRLKGGGNMPTLVDDGNIDLLYVAILHRASGASQADKDAQRGREFVKVADELYHSKEWSNQDIALKNPGAAQQKLDQIKQIVD